MLPSVCNERNKFSAKAKLIQVQQLFFIQTSGPSWFLIAETPFLPQNEDVELVSGISKSSRSPHPPILGLESAVQNAGQAALTLFSLSLCLGTLICQKAAGLC